MLKLKFKKKSIGLISKTTTLHVDCKTVRIFAYSSTREQSNEAENRERDWGEMLKIVGFFSLASHALRESEARALRARKTLTPRFTDFFADFEEKTDCFAVYFARAVKFFVHFFAVTARLRRQNA